MTTHTPMPIVELDAAVAARRADLAALEQEHAALPEQRTAAVLAGDPLAAIATERRTLTITQDIDAARAALTEAVLPLAEREAAEAHAAVARWQQEVTTAEAAEADAKHALIDAHHGYSEAQGRLIAAVSTAKAADEALRRARSRAQRRRAASTTEPRTDGAPVLGQPTLRA